VFLEIELAKVETFVLMLVILLIAGGPFLVKKWLRGYFVASIYM